MPRSTSTTKKQCPCKVCQHERSLRLLRNVCIAALGAGALAAGWNFVTFFVAAYTGGSLQPAGAFAVAGAALAYGANWTGKLLTDALNMVGEFRSIAAKYLK